MYYIGKVNDIIDLKSMPNVFIMSDFNVNICCTNVSHFGNMLNIFFNEENLVIADKTFLDSEAFTCISSACSWLDHVVNTHIITFIDVIKDFVTSNHIKSVGKI